MQNQLVTELADERGVIDVDVDQPQSPSVDIDINIRQDDLRMLETESGRLLLRTSEMDEGLFVEPVPTHEGVQATIAVGVEEETTEIEPAEPAEQPDVDMAASSIEVRMD